MSSLLQEFLEAGLREESSEPRSKKYRDALEGVLREILDEEIPSLMYALNFYARSVTGRDFIDCLIENPANAYRVLLGVFYLRDVVEIIDNAITRYFKKKYNVNIDKVLLGSADDEGEASNRLIRLLEIYMEEVGDKIETS